MMSMSRAIESLQSLPVNAVVLARVAFLTSLAKHLCLDAVPSRHFDGERMPHVNFDVVEEALVTIFDKSVVLTEAATRAREFEDELTRRIERHVAELPERARVAIERAKAATKRAEEERDGVLAVERRNVETAAKIEARIVELRTERDKLASEVRSLRGRSR